MKRAAAVRLLPLATEMGDWGLTIEGYTPPPNQGTPGDWQIVTPGYFETMGLTLREGRTFTAGDDMRAPLAMIVNRDVRATVLRRPARPRRPRSDRLRATRRSGTPSSASWTTCITMRSSAR